MSNYKNERWMHPIFWLMLFFLANPIWIVLIVLRFFYEIAMAVGLIFLAILAAYVISEFIKIAIDALMVISGNMLLVCVISIFALWSTLIILAIKRFLVSS